MLLLLACFSREIEPAVALPTEPPVAPPAPALISDEECVAKGGQVVTEETYAYLDRRHRDEPRTPFRICHYPSPKNGEACRKEADCAGGRCFCTGPLDRPDPQRFPELRALEGQEVTGRCSDSPLPSGEWHCLVSDGKARLQGIIVD